MFLKDETGDVKSNYRRSEVPHSKSYAWMQWTASSFMKLISIVKCIFGMANLTHFSSFVASFSHLQEHFQEHGHIGNNVDFGHTSPSSLTYSMLIQSVVNKDRFPNYNGKVKYVYFSSIRNYFRFKSCNDSYHPLSDSYMVFCSKIILAKYICNK